MNSRDCGVQGTGHSFKSAQHAMAVQVMALTLGRWQVATATSPVVTSSAAASHPAGEFLPLLVASCRAAEFLKQVAHWSSPLGALISYSIYQRKWYHHPLVCHALYLDRSPAYRNKKVDHTGLLVQLMCANRYTTYSASNVN